MQKKPQSFMDRIGVILTCTFGGAAFVPVIVILGFFSYEPTQFSLESIWSAILANLRLAVVLAVIGAVIGFILGMVIAITGDGRDLF